MIIRKNEYNHMLLAQEDRVIASAPIAHDGGKFLSMSGEVHVIGANDQNIATAVMAMLRGVVVPVYDWGDNTLDIDELWDIMVPKDAVHSGTAGNNQIDVGTKVGEENTLTFSEPGTPSVTALAGESYWGNKVYDREHIFTFAGTSDGFKDATPDTFIPNHIFYPSSSEQVRAEEVPGFYMLALGTPTLANTVGVAVNVINSEEWLILRHLTAFMEDAWKQFAGIDEAGAESPWLNLASLIVEVTEPLANEEVGGSWAQQSFNCFSRNVTYTYTPGDKMIPNVLTSG